MSSWNYHVISLVEEFIYEPKDPDRDDGEVVCTVPEWKK